MRCRKLREDGGKRLREKERSRRKLRIQGDKIIKKKEEQQKMLKQEVE